jgi:hypothetical protein
MRSLAVVIGVEQYWRRDACIEGPVDDACDFARWLVSDGGVAEEDISLLLSPLASTECSAPVWFEEATTDAILDAVQAMTSKAQDSTFDRLFFYFSGHGLQDIIDPRAAILLPCDFRDDRLRKTVHLNAIDDFLLSTNVEEQFIFSDACRDFAYHPDKTNIGDPTVFGSELSNLPAGQHVPYQLRISAASPGGTARTVPSPWGPQSAFTSTMLEALRRPGPAMRWDFSTGEYVVRADSLLRHVELEAHKRVMADPARDIVAAPFLPEATCRTGALRGPHPTLATFARDAVDSVSLEVLLRPDDVRLAHPTVAVLRDDDQEIANAAAEFEHDTVVARFDQLRPNDYLVRAAAIHFEPERPRYVWPVYGSTRELIKLIHSGDRRDRPPPPSDDSGRPGGDRGIVTGDFEGSLHLESAEGDHCSVHAHGADPFATVEIVTGGGFPMARGVGSTLIAVATPGVYRARELGSGRVAERPEVSVLISAGQRQRLTLPAIRRRGDPLGDMFDSSVRLLRLEDIRTLWFGRSSPDMMSVLSVLAEVVGVGRQHPAARIGDDLALVLSDDLVGPSGLVLLAANDPDTYPDSIDPLADLRITSLDNGGSSIEEMSRQEAAEGMIVQAFAAVEPGTQTVRIEQYKKPWIDLRVPILDGETTVITLGHDSQDRQSIQLFVLTHDPNLFGAGRRLEMLQRYLVCGDYRAAAAYFSGGDWISDRDGIGSTAPLFETQVWLALGRNREAVRAIDRLADEPAFASDAAAFSGLVYEREGQFASAARAYQDAAKTGLPISEQAVRVLHRGGRRLELKAPNVDNASALVGYQASGTVWSAAWRATAPPERSPLPPASLTAPAETAAPIVRASEPESAREVMVAGR